MTSGMGTDAIHLDAVSRAFGDVRAVDRLDLAIPPGSVAVLLGPNGAGKTTTVRLITGALSADAGAIRVLGMDPLDAGEDLRLRCGVVPPKPALYDQLTGAENLRFAADIYRVARTSIHEAAARFGIDHALRLKVGGYSTGMRTRLALARAVLHDPDVLLLDEPTAGLDPESARAVLDLIRDLAGRGRTIVMCTHLLHEAEGIADQVVLMGAGTARAAGKPGELAARYLGEPIVVIDAQDRSLLGPLEHQPGVVSASWNGALHLRLESLAVLPDLVARAVADGARLTRVEPQEASLETLYFEMQRQMRDETQRREETQSPGRAP
ncbi:MAG: ABC transporter ATP-binding protein [Acidimicrobiia bacterium]